MSDEPQPTQEGSAPRPAFDPELSPLHLTNRKAAHARNLIYDARKRAYVDADGCLIRDRFGQLI